MKVQTNLRVKVIDKKSSCIGKKIPTSVALDPRFVEELKKEASAHGIPYQILMRMFIVDGFQRFKKAGGF